VIRVAGGAGFIGANFILDWLRVNGGAVLDWTRWPACKASGCRTPQGVHLLPIPGSDDPAPATRPLNSRLNNDKLGQTFDLRVQDWRSALTLYLDAMKT